MLYSINFFYMDKLVLIILDILDYEFHYGIIMAS